MAKTLYAIFREEKRTNLSQVARSNKHNFRDQPTPNADPNLPGPRLLFGARNLSKAVKEKLPEKVRKNAVIAVEAVLTASPEYFAHQTPDQLNAWVNANVEWLKDRHGENLLQVVLHLDESTPHLHAYWMPLKDGKLNYRAIQGARKDLVDVQDGYAMAMRAFGLSRGQPKSAARHAHHSATANELTEARNAIVEAKESLGELSKHVRSLEGMAALRNTLKALSRGERREPRRPVLDAARVDGQSRATRRIVLEEVRPKVGLRV